jgi:glycosyltransferase involved in cell wall biosynthesis
LEDLFLSHSFFILPTRFDCTPIVFCEASSFALPILCSKTGGVEGHIKEGVNGFLMPYEDRGEAYAKKIMELYKDPIAYEALTKSTRQLYDEFLNWDTWSLKLQEALLTLETTH